MGTYQLHVSLWSCGIFVLDEEDRTAHVGHRDQRGGNFDAGMLGFRKGCWRGGSAVFVGPVRNQTKGKRVDRLDFESYILMAEKKMRKIAETAVARWGAFKVSIHHRVETLAVREVPVVTLRLDSGLLVAPDQQAHRSAK